MMYSKAISLFLSLGIATTLGSCTATNAGEEGGTNQPRSQQPTSSVQYRAQTASSAFYLASGEGEYGERGERSERGERGRRWWG